jgi:hypothetical protein
MTLSFAIPNLLRSMWCNTISGYFGNKVTQAERVETDTKSMSDRMNPAGIYDVFFWTWYNRAIYRHDALSRLWLTQHTYQSDAVQSGCRHMC